MKIALGADHAAFQKKEEVAKLLQSLGHAVDNVGTFSEESVDYPDFALAVGNAVAAGAADVGILLCGTGIGMCIAANKISGIRASVVWNPEIAKLSREHNNANILCLPGRFLSAEEIKDIVRTWLQTPFSTEPRHARRVEKMMALEKAPGGAKTSPTR